MPERVLVPIDGSPPARRAVSYACESFPDAEITVLHVIDPSDAVVAAEGAGPSVAQDWFERSRESADDLVEDALSLGVERGVDLEAETEVGNPARTIVSYADDGGFDHIVIGSHGRTGASRILLGSVAERVLRRASVPVTVVRGQD